jgi:tRNA pseudouridine38-40 synthase
LRIALGIEYDGTDFLGWQRLSHGPTVQGAVEEALSHVADHAVSVTCAGRTDSGVHARCQVVHFDSTADRTSRSWLLGANSRLPIAIGVRWVVAVTDDFHARYGAIARRYRYTILNRLARPALDARYVAWERRLWTPRRCSVPVVPCWARMISARFEPRRASHAHPFATCAHCRFVVALTASKSR